MNVTEIWVDKETGVNYLYHASGYSGGLTPLLDREGYLRHGRRRHLPCRGQRDLRAPRIEKAEHSHPLPAASSRGDQLLNAASFEAQGYSIVLNEDDITTNLLVEKVHERYFNRQKYVEAIGRSHQMDAVKTIMDLIDHAVEK